MLLAAPAAGAGLWAQRRFGRRFMESENLPLAGSEAEKRILAVLDEMAREGRLYASVPVSDGRMLRLLTETANAKSVVEIGTSTGYSGLWFCLALQATGGRLTTFEIDPGRAQMARDHFKKAGVDGMVTLVEGDAHQTTARLKEPIDVAFLDADKDGYVAYLNRLLPLVRPGGLILAHNLDMVPDYVREVTSNPRLDTVLYREGGGLAITLKKR
ncbi:MAG: O-methyltransferase [Bryobacteraceae bacterium]|nr:O-methyltransferase [Bryobacteraceae bacterium]